MTPSGSSSLPTAPSAASSTWRRIYEWAPTARALAPGSQRAVHSVGLRHRGVGRHPARRLRRPRRSWLRRGVDAIAAGSHDDGFVSAAAIHTQLSGGELAVSDEFLERSVASALESDDLHRQIWVLTYAGRFAEAIDRAGQLGNRTLIALARSRAAPLAPEGRDEARELFWEAAQECHSYLMRNHAAMRAGRRADPLRVAARRAACCSARRCATGSCGTTCECGRSSMRSRSASPRWVKARRQPASPAPSATARCRSLPRSRRRRSSSLLDDRPRRRAHAPGTRPPGPRSMPAPRSWRRSNASSSSPTRTRTKARPSPSTPADLTPRQQEVAGLVARGLTNKQIAQPARDQPLHRRDPRPEHPRAPRCGQPLGDRDLVRPPAAHGIRYAGEYLISAILGRSLAPYGRTSTRQEDRP